MATMTEASSGVTVETNPTHTERGSGSPMDRPRQVEQDIEAGDVTNAQGGPITPREAADSGPYTVFTKGQRAWITLLASTAAMVSPMSSYIYYPALVAVADDMRVSVALVNLTITSYLIVAGIAPSIMGDLADQGGRKPVYVVMWTLYIAANVGIALQTSYPALLVLRMLQSAGSSGLIPVAYGVISDISTPRNRGGYIGTFDLLINVALSLGPVMGGALANELGWRWIFWFLTILSSSQLLLMLLSFPETQRNIVGNGSRLASGVYWSLFNLLPQHKSGNSPSRSSSRNADAKPKGYYPNPLASLRILAERESLIAVLLYSVTYLVKMTLQASLGAQCVDIYDLDYLTAGLIYIPQGVAGILGSFATGRYLNRTYRLTVERLQCDDSGHANGDFGEFPIEKARLKGIYVPMVFSVLGVVGHGIALQTRAHISVMLIMQFVTGLTMACVFTTSATLLTDLNRKRSATAQAANSLVRCLAAAAGVAAMQPLANATNLVWCFVVYAIIYALQIPLTWLLCSRGVRWRMRAGAPASAQVAEGEKGAGS